MTFDRRKLLKALRNHGFEVLREGGRHTVLADAAGTTLSVPRHKAIARGTARAIVKQAGLNFDEVAKELS